MHVQHLIGSKEQPRPVLVGFDDIQRRLLAATDAAHAGHDAHDAGAAQSVGDGGAAGGGEDAELAAWKEARGVAKEQAEQALARGDTTLIVVDDNLYYRSMRYTYCQLARKYRVGLMTIFLNCPVTLAVTRNRQRDPSEQVELLLRKMCVCVCVCVRVCVFVCVCVCVCVHVCLSLMT
jgi:hypothetical protein